MANEAELLARLAIDGMGQFISDITRANDLFDALGNVARTVFSDIERLSVAAIGTFSEFTQEAVGKAAQLQTLTLSFSSLGDSVAYGRKEMEYLSQMHFLNPFTDVAAAALKLQEAGLNPNREIKWVDQLGALFGGGTAGLRQASEMLDRITSGTDPGRAVRPLQRIGIGKTALEAQGVKYDGTKIVSDASTVIDAIGRTVEARYAKMGAALEDSITVRFTHLQDAWNRLMASFGNAWFPLITSILDKLTPFVEFLTRSGEIEKIGKSFADLFGGMKDGGWVRILMFGISILEDLPNVLRSAWNYVSEFMGGFGNLLTGIVDIALVGIDDLVKAVNSLGPALNEIGNVARDVSGWFKSVSDWFNVPVPKTPEEYARMRREHAAGVAHPPSAAAPAGKTAHSMLEDFLHQLPVGGDYFKNKTTPRTDELMKKLDDWLKQPQSTPTDPNGGKMWMDGHVTDPLNAIKENTARVAAHMVDFKRYALGGGDYAEKGVSISDFYGSRGPMHSGPIQVQVNSGNGKMDEAMGDMFTNLMQQYHRQTGRRR